MGKGYHAVRFLRRRTKAQRGGNEKRADGLPREGQTLAVLMDGYLLDLKVKNHTERAVENRAWQLTTFLAWGDERGLCWGGQITRPILESYQRHLWALRQKNGKPLAVSTQRGLLGALKCFFAWLCRRHLLPANPASDLEMPRAEKRLPAQALSIREVQCVLAGPDISDPLGLRDRAILELFYSTGIRRSELARLAVSDLNREKRLLFIRRGKGHKDRVVPVGQQALSFLDHYLERVRPLLMVHPGEQGLFLTGYGEPFNPDVLGRKVVNYIKQANTGHSGGAHLLRHTCATHMLEGGADIRFIQQLLGHENLETTAIYTEVSIVQLKAVHARCHPAERRKPSPEQTVPE